VKKVARGTLKFLKQMALVEADEHGHSGIAKQEEDSKDSLADIQTARTKNKIALGSRGQRIRRFIQELEVDIGHATAEITGPLVSTHVGFSLYD